MICLGFSSCSSALSSVAVFSSSSPDNFSSDLSSDLSNSSSSSLSSDSSSYQSARDTTWFRESALGCLASSAPSADCSAAFLRASSQSCGSELSRYFSVLNTFGLLTFRDICSKKSPNFSATFLSMGFTIRNLIPLLPTSTHSSINSSPSENGSSSFTHDGLPCTGAYVCFTLMLVTPSPALGLLAKLYW